MFISNVIFSPSVVKFMFEHGKWKTSAMHFIIFISCGSRTIYWCRKNVARRFPVTNPLKAQDGRLYLWFSFVWRFQFCVSYFAWWPSVLLELDKWPVTWSTQVFQAQDNGHQLWCFWTCSKIIVIHRSVKGKCSITQQSSYYTFHYVTKRSTSL